MRVTEQLAVAPLPESVQEPLNNSLPELLRLMVPVGVSGVPAPSSSVTATATVAPWLTTTVEGVRVSVVVVWRGFNAGGLLSFLGGWAQAAFQNPSPPLLLRPLP